MTKITLSEALPAGTYSVVSTAPPIDPIPPVDPPVDPPAGARVIDLLWGQSIAWDSNANGGFACGETLIFRMDVPLDAIPTTNSGRISISEYGSPPDTRQLVASLIPGSFDYATAIPHGVSNGNTVTLYFGVGFNVAAGQTVYFNLRDWSVDMMGPAAPWASRRTSG